MRSTANRPSSRCRSFGWGTIPDQYGRISDGRDAESLVEPEIPFPFLHDELVRIIEINGGELMTSAELADTINAEGRYRKKDGSAVTSSQVSARVSKYPRLFDRDGDGRVGYRPPGRDSSMSRAAASRPGPKTAMPPASGPSGRWRRLELQMTSAPRSEAAATRWTSWAGL